MLQDSNESSMASNLLLPYLPPHIIHNNILPRLGVRDLVRFKCVSKSWKEIISSKEFAEKQLQISWIENRHNFLLFSNDNKGPVSLSVLDEQDSKLVTLPLSINDLDTFVGECRGWLCFRINQNGHLLVINPWTQLHRNIPLPEFSDVEGSFGFGFDHLLGCFKIVRVGLDSLDGLDCRTTHVFGFDENSWSLIEGDTSLIEEDFRDYFNPGVLVDNNLLVWKLDQVLRHFDLCNHKWGLILVPIDCGRIVGVARLMHKLCLVTCKNKEERPVEVWLLSEIGEEGSWMKLCSLKCWWVQYFNSNDLREFKCFPIPIAYSEDGKHILLRFSGNCLSWFNVAEKSHKNVKFSGLNKGQQLCYGTESLVYIDGAQKLAL